MRQFITICIIVSSIFSSQHVAAQKPPADTLRVGIGGNEPFIIDTTLASGISTEIWEALAKKLNIQYKTKYFDDVPHVLAALRSGQIDVAVGPISITADRAAYVKFTQPYFQSSLSILSATDHPSLWDRIMPFFSKKFFIALCVFLFILAIVGTFLWLAERNENPDQFPRTPSRGIANGMWCAIVTMTTTGYGDIAPRTFWGRFTAGAWMVVSLIFATSLIAGFASVLTLSGIHKSTITTAEELAGKKIGVVASSPAEDFVRENGGKIVDIDNLTKGYDMLSKKSISAIVFDRPQLQYFLREHPDENLTISAAEYQRQGYGFAFPLNDTDLHPVNVALLELQESGAINNILKKWLGNEIR